MGTYDELMNLGKAKKVQRPKPKPLPHFESKAIIPQSKPVVLRTNTDHTIEESPSSSKTQEIKKQSRDTVIPRHHATMTPRYHDIMIGVIRAAVIQFGKEAATHRFTPEEKKAIADIVYTFKMSNIRTNENEIARIAINFLVADYKENGENSILSQVLQALNS